MNGTEKQIKWAEKIKAEAIKMLTEDIEDDGADNDKEMEKMFSTAMAAMEQSNSAAWWINTQEPMDKIFGWVADDGKNLDEILAITNK